MAPKHSAEELLMFQEQECDEPYEENVFSQAWDAVLVAINSMLMSQQYILKKASLNTSTHKTRDIFISWWKCDWKLEET